MLHTVMIPPHPMMFPPFIASYAAKIGQSKLTDEGLWCPKAEAEARWNVGNYRS